MYSMFASEISSYKNKRIHTHLKKLKTMNRNYTTAFMSFVLVTTMASVSYAQGSKVKTVTIINGDTTISESNLDEKELAKMEKEMEIIINEEGDKKGTKKIVKKIVINDEKHDGEAMAYAYTIDENGGDVEVITDENGTTTKVIVKTGDAKDKPTNGKVVRKEVRTDVKTNEKSNVNVTISIKNTTAKVEIETSSKEPMNVSVLDENGKQVFYDTQKAGGKYSKEIPLGKKGTYFLNFIQNKASTTEKIIVE